jgi:CobB/CobQ-like glutamine amidotransferase domain
MSSSQHLEHARTLSHWVCATAVRSVSYTFSSYTFYSYIVLQKSSSVLLVIFIVFVLLASRKFNSATGVRVLLVLHNLHTVASTVSVQPCACTALTTHLLPVLYCVVLYAFVYCELLQLMALLGWVPAGEAGCVDAIAEDIQPRFVHNKSGRYESRCAVNHQLSVLLLRFTTAYSCSTRSITAVTQHKCMHACGS